MSKRPHRVSFSEHDPLLSSSHAPIEGSRSETSCSNERPSSGHGRLRRELSTRQVSMIAVGGTIGTGLFLGTGRSLAEGGPASILICYALVGFIVYVTLLLLGEMATQYPVAGSFVVYTSRFFSPSYGFAISWNYWFNDAVSVASDLTAAQLVLQYWTDQHTWVISLIFLMFLFFVNATDVHSYGEMEYLLSSLKVVTILAFILVGTMVNAGINREHIPIGFSNWRIGDAPFVSWTGFGKVFVTASFAYGGTESLGITAGETAHPSKAMPKIVRLVFWRILLFYVLSIFIIGLNVPYNYPNLSSRSSATSPFTIVFYEAGSNFAASFINTVVLSSVLSAGNHALFAGTRILYSLSTSNPPLAPTLFARTTKNGVPLNALLGTTSISVLCFASSFVGSGVLWGWLQNIVGVSNQLAWLSIGFASWRFRKAWLLQRPLEEMKFRVGWTWPWGPPFVIICVSGLILGQGWSSFYPEFKPLEFASLYIEVPVVLIMTAVSYAGWTSHTSAYSSRNSGEAETTNFFAGPSLDSTTNFLDLPDLSTIDLYLDEYPDGVVDDDALYKNRRAGRWRILWKIYDFMI